MTSLLLRNAAMASGRTRDLAVHDGVIVDHPHPMSVEVDVAGRPVVPGLADHHLHLCSLAAAWASERCDPERLSAAGGLAGILRRARRRTSERWLRGTQYDLDFSGWIDRRELDAIGVGPLRIQDRTGAYWILDSQGLAQVLPPDPAAWPSGVERDAAGRPTGRLVRLDDWLRDRVPAITTADRLTSVGRWLATRGVTAVTDATHTNTAESLALLGDAHLPQRLRVMTADPEPPAHSGFRLDAVKILLDDSNLPSVDELTARIATAHRHGRSVAVHCVTDVQVLLALASGVRRGDRLEHATVVSDEMLPLIRTSGAAVCVQPGLVHARGDRYLAQTEPAEHAELHRLASLRRAGMPLIGGTDAPFGDPDPWTAISAAVHRRTSSGARLGAPEALDRATALELFHSAPTAPWAPRTLAVGQQADLLVLDGDGDDPIEAPTVLLTVIGGVVVHASGPLAWLAG